MESLISLPSQRLSQLVSLPSILLSEYLPIAVCTPSSIDSEPASKPQPAIFCAVLLLVTLPTSFWPTPSKASLIPKDSFEPPLSKEFLAIPFALLAKEPKNNTFCKALIPIRAVDSVLKCNIPASLDLAKASSSE